MSERYAWKTAKDLAVAAFPVGGVSVHDLVSQYIGLMRHEGSILIPLALTREEAQELTDDYGETLRRIGGRIDEVDLSARHCPQVKATFRRFSGETYQVTRELRAFQVVGLN